MSARKSAQFEVFKGAGGFFFRLRARNGEIVLSSERYPTAAHARRGVASAVRMMLVSPLVLKDLTGANE